MTLISTVILGIIKLFGVYTLLLIWKILLGIFVRILMGIGKLAVCICCSLVVIGLFKIGVTALNRIIRRHSYEYDIY